MAWRWRRKKNRVGKQLSRIAQVLHWGLRIFLILLFADLFYLTLTWPDWKSLAAGPVPKSSFIQEYELKRAREKNVPPLNWRPTTLAVVPKHLTRAVILAEDGRFYKHSGFDMIAFKDAMQYNYEKGRLVLGASTISQQTVKNLFLSPSRNPVRKWHELVLTWGMEQNLNKRRILELYLNVAEFGRGIYGVQAAAHAYFGTSVADLTPRQSAELVASLPSPVKHNPATRTSYFQKRSQKILALMMRFPGDAVESMPLPLPRELEPPPREELILPPPPPNGEEEAGDEEEAPAVR